jgi:hypothetical protein
MAVACEEIVNLTKSNYLLEHFSFQDFFLHFDWGNEKEARIQYKKIKDYLVLKVKGTEYAKYNYVKNRNNGRLYGDKTSIQNVPKFIRGFICDGLTTDIDMKNAHPSILYQLCKQYEYECPNLEKYINEREEILNRIMNETQKTKEQAKKIILTATNTNKKISCLNCEFVANYSKEMRKLQKKFMENKDYEYVKEYARDDGNFEGSFINHILCIHENEILTAMRNYCYSNQLSIHSLAFDGLMLNGEFNETILPDIEQYIISNTKFNMTLTIKPNASPITITDDFTPSTILLYPELKKEFEEKSCKVGSQFVRQYNDGYEIYGRGEFNTLNEELSFRPQIGKDPVDFMPVWFKDADKKVYERFDCYPKNCPKNVFNTWLPFAAVSFPDPELLEGDIYDKSLKYFLNHIDILCGREKPVYDFVIMWLAQMFQYPENKSIHINFISKEGAGKGMFLRYLRAILGERKLFEPEDPLRDVFGHFNGGMRDAFLVVLNELDKSKTYNSNSKLKQLITDDSIQINEKGIKTINMKSYHRFIGFSNMAEPSTKNKRRDLNIRCSDEVIDNNEYFKEGNSYIQNPMILKHIYNHFMKEPTKAVINQSDIPETDYDIEMAKAQEKIEVSFLKDFVMTNKNCNIEQEKISADRLYEKYKQYCKGIYDDRQVITKISFGMKITFLKLKSITKDIKKINGKTANIYIINTDELIKELKIDIDEYNNMEVFNEDSSSDED